MWCRPSGHTTAVVFQITAETVIADITHNDRPNKTAPAGTDRRDVAG